jgi:hypothetical protein
MYASSLHGNREIPECNQRSIHETGSVGEGLGRTSDMNASGKSDGGIVSMKRANKGAQPRRSGQPPAEFVEKRPPAKGNSVQASVTSTQRLETS